MKLINDIFFYQKNASTYLKSDIRVEIYEVHKFDFKNLGGICTFSYTWINNLKIQIEVVSTQCYIITFLKMHEGKVLNPNFRM